MKRVDKPFWQSQQCLIYLITLASVCGMAIAKIDSDIITPLSMALAGALPLLIAGKAWVDKTAVSKGKSEDEESKG